MDFSKIAKLIPGLMMGKVDEAKLAELANDFITDENIAKVVKGIYKVYQEESMKLGAGHFLQLNLQPVFEEGQAKGLKLSVLDCIGNEQKIISETLLHELKAEQIQQLIAQIFSNKTDTKAITDGRQ